MKRSASVDSRRRMVLLKRRQYIEGEIEARERQVSRLKAEIADWQVMLRGMDEVPQLPVWMGEP